MEYSAKYKTQKRIKVADLDLSKSEKTFYYNSGVFTKVYGGKGKNNWIGYVLIDVFFNLNLKLKSSASFESKNKIAISESNYLNSLVPQSTFVLKIRSL